MKDLKEKIELIIEQSASEKPKCKNCKSFSNGTCLFGCVNERNGYFNFGREKNVLIGKTGEIEVKRIQMIQFV